MTTVVMDAAGNLRLPEELRRELGIDGETQFEASPDEYGALVLRPVADDFPEEDVRDPEHFREVVRRAEEDYAAGRTFKLTPAEFRRILGIDG